MVFLNKLLTPLGRGFPLCRCVERTPVVGRVLWFHFSINYFPLSPKLCHILRERSLTPNNLIRSRCGALRIIYALRLYLRRTGTAHARLFALWHSHNDHPHRHIQSGREEREQSLRPNAGQHASRRETAAGGDLLPASSLSDLTQRARASTCLGRWQRVARRACACLGRPRSPVAEAAARAARRPARRPPPPPPRSAHRHGRGPTPGA